MEPRARRDIHIEIGVMHPVQVPEQWLMMEQPMLKIDCQVQHDDRGDKAQPEGQVYYREQTPTMALGIDRQAKCSGWSEQPGDNCTNKSNPDVRRPAIEALGRSPAPWK